jgi:hypothetical protein
MKRDLHAYCRCAFPRQIEGRLCQLIDDISMRCVVRFIDENAHCLLASMFMLRSALAISFEISYAPFVREMRQKP